jgi:adenylosuccinate synthase
LINDEIKAGKRILVEDCSSSSLDIDTGIYPYTSSFHTTTGAVCTGLGVPEECIETTIGVMSAMTIIDRAFLSHIKNFPSQVLETELCHSRLSQKVTNDYRLPEDEYELGWTDLNLVRHAERLNTINSLFVTHLDLLDELDQIKVCTAYQQRVEGADGTPEVIEKIKGRLPASIREFGQWEPEFDILKGW